MVTYILGSKWLNADAALSWFRMVQAGMPVYVTSAGRTNEEQWREYNKWIANGKKKPPSVAYPGTSLHEKGNAVDVPEPTRRWLHANGERFGWVNPAWAKKKGMYEPWHFEYNPKKDKYINQKLKEWDEMATEKEIRNIVAEEIKKVIPEITKQLLNANVGRNPATGKPSSVSESLQISRNYSYHNYNLLKDM